MIDWVTAIVPCRHSILESDRVFKISSNGDIQWETACRVKVTGSHDSSIQVKSHGVDEKEEGMISHLLISGNPSKFLQGHNIFGSDDVLALVHDTLLKLCQILKIDIHPDDLRQVEKGDYPLKMVDINYSYQLPTRRDVLSVIRALEYKSKTRHGRPSMKGGTLYFGKSSQRWAIKAYSKGEEIEAKNHQLPEQLKSTKLPLWADNKLRLELRLKLKELQQIGVNKAKDLPKTKVVELFNEYLSRIDMSEQIALTDDKELELPQKLKLTYIAWKNGQDLRSTLPKTTYYRHRKELLAFGINIDLRQDNSPTWNVVPLIRVLEAKPANIPSWAYTDNLIHFSA